MLQRILNRLVRLSLRLFYKPFIGPPFPYSFQRRYIDLAARAAPGPRSASSELVDSPAGVPLYRVRAGAGPASPAERPALLWAHGGGFVLGSARSHGGLAGHLARASGADVYLPEYRLAPEDPHPAATDDLFSAYRAVLDRGHDPARVAVGGDSAGGALIALTALAIREMDMPSPAAMVLLSPVTDLAASGASFESKASVEPLLRRDWLLGGYRAYAGPLALTDPRVSPLYADLHGLPPTLIQVGEDEVLLDDSLRFADRAWGADVEVELQRFPGLWHDFQIEAAILRDAADAVGDIGAFLRRRWGA
jgi:monoterpene epsilon-lactone hydrolase